MKSIKLITVFMLVVAYSSIDSSMEFDIKKIDVNDANFNNIMEYGDHAHQLKSSCSSYTPKKSIRFFDDSAQKLSSIELSIKRTRLVDTVSASRKYSRISSDEYINTQVNVYIKKEKEELVQLRSILKINESSAYYLALEQAEAHKKQIEFEEAKVLEGLKDRYIKKLIRTHSTNPQVIFNRTVQDVIYSQATLQHMKSQAASLSNSGNINEYDPTQAEIDSIVQSSFIQAKKEIDEDSLRRKNSSQESLFDQHKRKLLHDVAQRYFKDLLTSYPSGKIYNGIPANQDVYATQKKDAFYAMHNQLDNHVMTVDVGMDAYGKCHALLLQQSAEQEEFAKSSSNKHQSYSGRALSMYPDIYKRTDMNARTLIDLQDKLKEEARRIINSK
jgi:hypothetical protein